MGTEDAMLIFLLHGGARIPFLHLRITRLVTLKSLLRRFVRWISCHSVLLHGGHIVTEVCNGTKKCAMSSARNVVPFLGRTAYYVGNSYFFAAGPAYSFTCISLLVYSHSQEELTQLPMSSSNHNFTKFR